MSIERRLKKGDTRSAKRFGSCVENQVQRSAPSPHCKSVVSLIPAQGLPLSSAHVLSVSAWALSTVLPPSKDMNIKLTAPSANVVVGHFCSCFFFFLFFTQN